MGYGFLMFKVKDSVKQHQDLSEETTEVIGTIEQIQRLLTQLFPETKWHQSPDTSAVHGYLLGPDTRYEFNLFDEKGKCFGVKTSHRTDSRVLIPEICAKLGLVAFDGQACVLVRGTGDP